MRDPVNAANANPYGVAAAPDGRRIYVTNISAGTVSVIDIATATVVDTINVGLIGGDIAITPDGQHAYISLGNDVVAVLDLARWGDALRRELRQPRGDHHRRGDGHGRLHHQLSPGPHALYVFDTATRQQAAPTTPLAAAPLRVESDQPVVVERLQYWPHGAGTNRTAAPFATATRLP
jgi:YVTN family beta-propeller protein